jgi:hypothetical protein
MLPLLVVYVTVTVPLQLPLVFELEAKSAVVLAGINDVPTGRPNPGKSPLVAPPVSVMEYVAPLAAVIHGDAVPSVTVIVALDDGSFVSS